MSHHDHKTAAELEYEIEARRASIERKVDELANRLSPGQLLDEALRFTRNGPAADFTRNMGRSVVNNPIPVALMAASMAWLAARPEGIHAADGHDPDHGDGRASAAGVGRDELGEEYPLAVIKGSHLRRVSTEPSSEHEGHSHTGFVDEAGRRFHALTDAAGNRAGHFRDEAGGMFRGFIDETGHRVTDFRDEAGKRLHEAAGWASHTWENASDRAGHLGHRLRDGSRQFGHMANDAGHALRSGGGQAVHAVDDFVHNQPLVSGAIAFAVGAVLAGMLPRTRQEDEVFGETSDALKRKAGEEAGHLYERGRQEAEHLHDEMREAAADIHDRTREAASQAHDAARDEIDKMTRH